MKTKIKRRKETRKKTGNKEIKIERKRQKKEIKNKRKKIKEREKVPQKERNGWKYKETQTAVDVN